MWGTEKLERKSWSLPVSARAGASNPHDRAGVNVYSTRPNTGHRKEKEEKKRRNKTQRRMGKRGGDSGKRIGARTTIHVWCICGRYQRESSSISSLLSWNLWLASYRPHWIVKFPHHHQVNVPQLFLLFTDIQKRKKNTTYELPYYTNLHSEIYCLNWKSSPAVGPFHRNQKGKEVVVYLNCLYLQQELHILRGTKFFIVWSIKKKRRNS